MNLTLSTGLDLSTLTTDEITQLVRAAQYAHAGVPLPVAREKKRETCVFSPYTEACTRCGRPNTSLATTPCQEMVGSAMAATIDMRARWTGTPKR